MTEVAFDKYGAKGAYHWVEYFGPVHRINAYTRARYDAIVRVLQANGIGPASRVLDVGCGDAALAGLIAMRLGAGVDGIDTTPMSIELARTEFKRRRLKGEFRLIDSYEYPFEPGTFDAVVCSDVIEHVNKPDTMLREMWRVLKPGGVLAITTPIRTTEQPLDPNHVQEWFADEFRRLCEDALDVRVELRASHAVAFADLYAAPNTLGRISRLSMNVLTKLGYNVFSRTTGFRVWSTQMVVAKRSFPSL